MLGATDFSDPALPAVKMAAAEARRRGVRFRLVHCLDIDEAAYVGWSRTSRRGRRVAVATNGHGINWRAAARERWLRLWPKQTSPPRGLVVRSSPASGILEPRNLSQRR